MELLKTELFCLAQIIENVTDFLFCTIITENFNLAITDDRQELFSFSAFVQLKKKKKKKKKKSSAFEIKIKIFKKMF